MAGHFTQIWIWDFFDIIKETFLPIYSLVSRTDEHIYI